jgi:hypothetical protein
MRSSHSGWRPLAGTLLLLLADKLLPAMGAGTVSTAKSCYHLDEDIVLTFYNDDPGDDDWVGIYPFNTASGDEEPSMWVSRIGSVSGKSYLCVILTNWAFSCGHVELKGAGGN